jgi:hypothetical protein
VLLADDALAERSAAASLFTDHTSLPELVSVDEWAVDPASD